jgi:hypothetical protein
MSKAEEKTVSKDGYEFTFYPAFASRCTVRNTDGEVELYRQEETYRLPDGEKHPAKDFRLSLKGGRNGQDVTMRVEDPGYRIRKITVELYDRTDEPGLRTEGAETETVEVMNEAKFCPPLC